ncbi:TPM domain-containing protein [Maribacter sp. TH_r10]|uniref:TPM domain-containing protein n=1 Tax=Maribacter luteus TaxID=2594478 RepID=A0A6I2MJ29_9FLAO|nr:MULTISPECIES: TPM domain-containing protein [Maribacter]MDV7138261.1 TPM domain-containing protein [Maribacter sp. TH_r10]MRX62570.1 TPM domain-containing protein [Maribacter luteus]|tara:strand:+ start:117 stop:554 length:438 start_codon:yes stop_codon:yes gene_type:complete
MSKVEDLLTAEEEQEIIQAIVDAEKKTSGEIRVHLESRTKIDLLDRAKEVFHLLKMDNTKEENGVLIYVAVNDKKFAIYGDRGINNAVPEDFWKSTKDIIEAHFKNGRFKEGLIEGITKAGKELEVHFPWHHGDVNELSNEISKN